MNINKLKDMVYRENHEVFQKGLAPFTFGNVSGIDRANQIIVIKPSGVPYSELTSQKMVCVSLENGEIIDSEYNPSSDTPTHLEIYRSFPNCGGVVHTHSEYATAFAQACEPIRCNGTTHADYFFGDIPVTRQLLNSEIQNDYEKNTGKVIVETFENLDSDKIPGVLVANHGPFVWGETPMQATQNAMILEYVAKLQYRSGTINPKIIQIKEELLKKHFSRKHGKNSYYGQ
jgi:L-ribulose-5-phosphate 4-epimerase